VERGLHLQRHGAGGLLGGDPLRLVLREPHAVARHGHRERRHVPRRLPERRPRARREPRAAAAGVVGHRDLPAAAVLDADLLVPRVVRAHDGVEPRGQGGGEGGGVEAVDGEGRDGERRRARAVDEVDGADERGGEGDEQEDDGDGAAAGAAQRAAPRRAGGELLVPARAVWRWDAEHLVLGDLHDVGPRWGRRRAGEGRVLL